MLETVIAVIVISLILGGAITYVVISKKRGKKCIGCPDNCACSAGNCSGGCGGCASQEK